MPSQDDDVNGVDFEKNIRNRLILYFRPSTFPPLQEPMMISATIYPNDLSRCPTTLSWQLRVNLSCASQQKVPSDPSAFGAVAVLQGHVSREVLNVFIAEERARMFQTHVRTQIPRLKLVVKAFWLEGVLTLSPQGLRVEAIDCLQWHSETAPAT